MAAIIDLGDVELLKAFHAWLQDNPQEHQEPLEFKVINWVIQHNLNKSREFFGARIGRENPYLNSRLHSSCSEFVCNYECWQDGERKKELAQLEQNPEYRKGFECGYYSPWTPLLTTPDDNTPFGKGYADGRNTRCFERR